MALTPESRAGWERLGGRLLQLTHRGQALNLGATVDQCEDLTGRFLGASRAIGWAAVVRPDRMVLCEGPAADGSALLAAARALLDPPCQPSPRTPG